MKFILYSLNYSPELTGIGKYNGDMSPALVDMGMQVTAIVAPPYYPEWKVASGYKSFKYQCQKIENVKIIRCPLYVPKKVSTVKRLVHLSSFACSSALACLTQLFKKPDVIFLVQPTFFCAPIVLLVSKITGAKAIMHIQDFEVDAMFGLGMMGQGKLAKLVKKVESLILKRFDVVSSISYSMLENAKRKGVEEGKLLYFPNWADINFVHPNIDGSSFRSEFGFTDQDRIVLYSGNIGAKQGLEMVIDAAESFRNEKHIKFVLVGSGVYAETLQQLANQRNLENVFFKPLQPWERVPEMLSMADIHLVIQKKGAADAVLPSKLTNILSVGGYALVTAEENTELGQLEKKFPGIYKCVEPEDSQCFITALRGLLGQKTSSYNVVARNYAEQYLDKDVILRRFYNDINELLASKQSSFN